MIRPNETVRQIVVLLSIGTRGLMAAIARALALSSSHEFDAASISGALESGWGLETRRGNPRQNSRSCFGY